VEAVTVSPKFQVVIPKHIRESLKLRPGDKLSMVHMGNAVQLMRVPTFDEARGFLKGAISTDFTRERSTKKHA
jgi:AbrB family looped-hinge helix DNA binding protein